MSTIRKYYQIQATIDSKIIGRSELPLSVLIKDTTFAMQSRTYMLDVQRYFDDKKDILKNFPKNTKGRMYQRKKDPIDLMLAMPMYVSIEFIISKKVKDIFQNLKIDSVEYQIEELSIEGYLQPYYFLFIPLLENKDFINYERSVFYSRRLEKTASFGTYENYLLAKNDGYHIKKLVIANHLKHRDIISLQSAGPFFSDRIINAFKEHEVVGYDIIQGGDFKVDLNFDTD